MSIRNIMLFIFIIFLFSCKKKDCKVLYQKQDKAWDEYAAASINNNNNPTEQNKNTAIEKYNIYEKSNKDFTDRGCYYSKYKKYE